MCNLGAVDMFERSIRQWFCFIGMAAMLGVLLLSASPSQSQDITKQSGAPAESSITDTVGGFFSGVWGGVVDVVTLKAVFDDDDQAEPMAPNAMTYTPQTWDRPRQSANDTGSMSRMMSRMAGVVGGTSREEDEFGLPK